MDRVHLYRSHRSSHPSRSDGKKTSDAVPSDGNMERRQRRAAPDLRHGALAHVTIGQRLASARHSIRVLTLHPLLCPPTTPPLCNNNHRPTDQPKPTQPNPTQPYPSAAHRNFFSLCLLCLSISLERMHGGARMHIRSPRTHTPALLLLSRGTRARRNKERTRNERASGREGGRHGRRGGGVRTQRKVTRFTGNARKPRERRGEGREAAEMDRQEGGGRRGRVHARRVSYN